MNIVCFGANGVTGRLVVKQALAEGHGVTAFTRHPEAFPIRNDQQRVAGGDVYDPSSVDKAVSSQDAVLSSLGVPFSPQAHHRLFARNGEYRARHAAPRRPAPGLRERDSS
jgi:putative NADH-flavin reductase